MEPCPSEETFVELLQGELGPEEKEALDAHLDTCADCARLMADLGAVVSLSGEDIPAQERDAGEDAAATESIRIGGRYIVQRLVGRGGMGVVYEAYDDALGRRVAIKVLRSDLVDPARRDAHAARLLREARLLAAVSHPHVLAVYDVGVWNEQVYMAVHFVEGTTLREWIQNTRPSWTKVLEVYQRIGAGLAQAHGLGLVHRDVKPDNILVSAVGHPWLADFGLACAIGGDVAVADEEERVAEVKDLNGSIVTRSGAVVGTPAYMSPEQYRGEEAQKAADQFSFCAALFESLYATRAHPGESFPELKQAVCEGRRVKRPRSGVPKPVHDVLVQGLSTDPKERFATMEALLAALDSAAKKPSLAHRLLKLAAWALAIFVGLVGLASTVIVLSAVFFPVEENTEDEDNPIVLDDFDMPAEVTEPARKLSPEELKAKRKANLSALNKTCVKDGVGCASLLQSLDECCVSYTMEGVVSDDLYKMGSEGALERFAEMCKDHHPQACTHAAMTYAFSFHDYSTPESDMTPKWVAWIEEGCRMGDIIACFAVQDTYGDAAYNSEGDYSVRPDKNKLIDILEEGCRAGEPRACWMISESLLTSSHLAHDIPLALEYLEPACRGGYALACLMGGLIYDDRDTKTCQQDLRLFYQEVPTNDYFDHVASWSDVGKFCEKAKPFRDRKKAEAFLASGCLSKTWGENKTIRKDGLSAAKLSCQALKTIKDRDP